MSHVDMFILKALTDRNMSLYVFYCNEDQYSDTEGQTENSADKRAILYLEWGHRHRLPELCWQVRDSLFSRTADRTVVSVHWA